MAGVSDMPVPIGDIDLQQKAEEMGLDFLMPSVYSLHLGSKGPLIPRNAIRTVQQRGFNINGIPDFGYGGKDPECRIIPDPKTLIRLPWKPNIGWVACFVYMNSKPSPRCPRNALINQIARLKEHGLVLKTGFEAEFMMFNPGTVDPKDATNTGTIQYHDPNCALHRSKFLGRMFDSLNELGWDPYQVEREFSDGQYEMNYGYCEALQAADRWTFFKFMLKAIGKEEDMRISFMPLFNPKGACGPTGCGLHINASLWNASNDTSAMDDQKAPLGMSDAARHFMAGIMKHMVPMTGICCATPNSFRRLHIFPNLVNIKTWGIETKMSAMRVVKNEGVTNRYEYRQPDPACNPYFTVAAMIAAGLDGIENKLEPEEDQRHEEELLNQAPPEGVTVLPLTQEIALAELEKEPFFSQALGKEIIDAFIDIKRYHLTYFQKEVTQYEIDMCDIY